MNDEETSEITAYPFGPDNPTGAWQQAIDYLNRAEALMQQMAVETPVSRFTLADLHGATFTAARASVGGHYRHEWMRQAAPPIGRVIP